MKLFFHEDNFVVKKLRARRDVEAALRLRHDVFARELRWVPESTDGMERDMYDGFSDAIGVFGNDRALAGHLRLTPSPHPFMIEKEFLDLLPGRKPAPKLADYAEATRLCVRPDLRLGPLAGKIAAMLYKGMYHWSLSLGVRFMMIVVDRRCFRHLRMTGLTVEPVGEFTTMPDGVSAAACRIDWRAFEKEGKRARPEFFAWMSELRPRHQARALSHGPCSRRSACARYSARGTSRSSRLY